MHELNIVYTDRDRVLEKLGFVFIIDVEYDFIFSNYKMIIDDLSNCTRLQQDVNVVLIGRNNWCKIRTILSS